MDLLVVGGIIVGLVVVVALVVWLSRRREIVVIAPPLPPPPAGVGDDTVAVVQALVAQGQKIEAIKHVRQMTGWGLKEAKNYVDALQSGSPPPMLPNPRALAPTQPDLAQGEPELRALLAQGQKIEAIKRVRQMTGWGLNEAKDYVDRL